MSRPVLAHWYTSLVVERETLVQQQLESLTLLACSYYDVMVILNKSHTGSNVSWPKKVGPDPNPLRGPVKSRLGCGKRLNIAEWNIPNLNGSTRYLSA